MAVAADENRVRGTTILETIAASQAWLSGGYGACTKEEVEDVAEALNVPPALIVLGSTQMSAAQVDELVAWWLRKDDGEGVA